MGSVATAQKAETPAYRFDTGAKINEITLTQGETMVVTGQRTSKEGYAAQVAVYDLNTVKKDYKFDMAGKGGTFNPTAVMTGTLLLLKTALFFLLQEDYTPKKHRLKLYGYR